jgi:hypothetical protein
MIIAAISKSVSKILSTSVVITLRMVSDGRKNLTLWIFAAKISFYFRTYLAAALPMNSVVLWSSLRCRRDEEEDWSG